MCLCQPYLFHGKLIHFPTFSRTENVVDSTMEDLREEDKLEDMICDVGAEAFAK